MLIETRAVRYGPSDAPFEGVLAFDSDRRTVRPGVVIAHGWMGQGSFETERARSLAALGYAALAIDLYGAGRRATSAREAAALMGELDQDRSLLQGRMGVALEALKALPEVDRERTAAIGYCFGGKAVLDLARSGAALQGIVCLHGVYDAPAQPSAPIVAKILVCHGWDDPICPPEATLALVAELSAAGADWQIHAYGGTSHAFTSPSAASPEKGLVYSASADRRSWQAVQDFLGEVIGS